MKTDSHPLSRVFLFLLPSFQLEAAFAEEEVMPTQL